MSRTPVERLLAEANPVPTPPPGHVTTAQERVLSSILAAAPAAPGRRLHGAARLLVAASAVAAVALAAVLVVGRDAGKRDEVEVTAPGTTPAVAEDSRLVHVVTRLYGTLHGPGSGERLDGWLEPSTGRVRIVITTGGAMTLQQVVGPDDHVRTWQGEGSMGNVDPMTDDRIAPRLAANLRRLVADRMTALIELAKVGFRRDNTVLGEATTQQGEYEGRPVTIHRVAPTLKDGGGPSGYYFKWYTDRGTGAVVAFERGPVGPDGRDVVEEGEEFVGTEGFADGKAPLHELEWEPPAAEGGRALPPQRTPTPSATAGPTGTPTPPDRPTPTPTPTASPAELP